MTSKNEERAFVTSMYSGPKWRKKVAKMGDAQIFAIYQKEQARRVKEVEDKTKKESEGDDLPF